MLRICSIACLPYDLPIRYADHETALSAVRNSNNTDVGGRSLRIDLADTDPFLEGKTTVRGEIIDGGAPGPNERYGKRDELDVFLSSLPAGTNPPPGKTAMDTITQITGAMDTSRSMDVLAQMKAFVITHPEHARRLLQAHPQLAYALFQSLFVNRITDPMILTRMLEASGGQPQAQHQPQGHVQAPPPIPAVPSYPVYNQMPPPPPPNMYAAPPQQPQSYYRGPPPQPTPPPQMAMPNVTEEQKAVLLQVLSMPQERINALPEGERNAIQQLRAQFMGVM